MAMDLKEIEKLIKEAMPDASIEIHSRPKDPVPAYKSRTSEFFILTPTLLEWLKILKMFSLTLSFNGLVFTFSGK